MLNQRQQNFCHEYAKSGNGTQSYQLAYGAKDSSTAQAAASRLLANTEIQNYLKELSEEVKSESIASIEELQAGLTKIFRGEMTTPLVTKDGEIINAPVSIKDRLKAAEILCKTQGAFLTRQKVEMTTTTPIIIVDNV